MKINFQQQLDKQLLQSERRRIIIIIIIFSSALIFRLLNLFFIKTDEETKEIDFVSAVWLFPFVIILFELLSLLYINKLIRQDNSRIPVARQFINMAVEVCLPSFIIWFIAKNHPTYNVLHSPAIFIYFIFVILSTLRLNFALSFFCGLLASLSYVLFSVFIYNHFNSNDAARAFILLFSGIAAGLVAKQIRSGIDGSLKETEKRHKVESLFGKQLSTEVATKMLENDGKIESRKMNVAIMFIDIRNFSRFAAGKSPEEIVKYQNTFFSIIINSVTKHHGIVHQFLGDGCMITFGAPIELFNPAQYAVDAARELLNALDTAVAGNELAETKIGIGIHTGEVVTGNIGTADRQQYSITGQVVILASRIEQLNKQFDSQLLISEDVAWSIKNDEVPATSLGGVDVKGWNEPVAIYKLA